MQKISLLIPIGRFSYFVHACLRNIFETCGATDQLDFVFLTSKTVAPEIQTAFKKAKKFFPFRIISAPFEAWPDHQLLLDWAVREADLTNWIIIQHCDLFWMQKNWLPYILNSIQPDLMVLYCSHPSHFWLGSKNMPVVGDFFGVYNRQQLIQKNLFFKWGTLGVDLSVSPKVFDAIQSGELQPSLKIGDFIDGSQAMAWELMVNYPESIKAIYLNFYHLIAFFRIADWIKKRNNVIVSSFPIGWYAYASYSYVTSFCIERKEVENVALPWSVFKRFVQEYGYDIATHEIIGKWLQEYSQAKQVIGENDLGIKKVGLRSCYLPPLKLL